MKDGKAYAHKTGNRIGDLYHTPKSLVWVAADIIKKEFNIRDYVLEPACGAGAISEELENIFLANCVQSNDLNGVVGIDYLNWIEPWQKQVITNPPFSLWDEFIVKAKTHCNKFMFIGKCNFLGAQGRYNNNIWRNLKGIYPFNRYVDYQTPYRKDGLFHVGCLQSAWFLWDMEFEGDWSGHVLDVQKYAKLGGFK